jgi:hypothetical protein
VVLVDEVVFELVDAVGATGAVNPGCPLIPPETLFVSRVWTSEVSRVTVELATGASLLTLDRARFLVRD